jgi:hypothetical protein
MFEVLTLRTSLVVFWVVTPCRLVGGADISEERVTSIIRFQVTGDFCPEDGGANFLRNV